MDSYIQVVSFLVSFVYGCGFYLLARFNRYILNNKGNFIKLLITTIFIIDIVVLYVYIMFRINEGIIHPYFLTTLIMGFIMMGCSWEKWKKFCKVCVKKIKTLK